ncbi:MAG: DUF6538 domain-containing protein, partial [Sedimenticolaceae bacterium]
MGQIAGQRHLLRRGSIYYFRWRLPADLRPILGATDLERSLCTADHLRAAVRAAPLELAVADIQRVRQAYFASELDSDEYVSALKRHWMRVCSMARRKRETCKTGLITHYYPDGSRTEIERDSA